MDAGELMLFLQRVAVQHPDRDNIVFLCIGTDRSTGDAFGPLVGTRLTEAGFPHVVGTLAVPCDADRLGDALRSMPADKKVVAIDACLGKPESVGNYLVANGALYPAQAVGVQAPAAGDYSIAGVVNVYGPKPYAALQTTSLHDVLKLANSLAEAIELSWPN
ncbi:spore protease YyaC [Paenibacillaceae bacterium]|nr:spore protease YyaC [Paenibacillaceae bacterium]